MAHYLPPAIMQFFQPRPPMEYKEQCGARKHALPPIQGVAQYVHLLKDAPVAPVGKQETPADRRNLRREKWKDKSNILLKRAVQKWDPKEVDRKEGATNDAYKTLFVGRLAYGVTADDLKSEFEFYGPVVNVNLVKDKKGKSRGYAFIEFENSKDLKEAYKDADGRKVRERRIVVDVERGRTVKNWRPRRLGGGLGATRVGSKEMNQKYSGRQLDSMGPSSYDRDRDRDRDRRDRERDRDRERERERERDREEDRKRERGRERDRSRSRGRKEKKDRKKGHSRSRSRGRSHSRSHSRSRSPSRSSSRHSRRR